ncbi:tetratricopeptide repeat protein [Hazenella coriacea]|uniref:Tetratricopeptide repeat protein n=1 Tax=Hazenella coriacea TaxID=1179467 RepID=A0A4R3LA19_9BACL|nr:tetratricopeptide repeat protein [Hazenella coriacea]TCS95084.1 tetratricopeptide repeat protein [Hazenella coriacea]
MAGSMIETHTIVQVEGKRVPTKSYRRSRAKLERLIKKNPQIEHYLVLAHIEATRQHWDRAQMAIEAALKLDPMHEEAQLLMAQILEGQNDLQAAHSLYQSILKNHPHFSKAYREYGRYMMVHTDCLSMAQNFLLHSLELNPKDALAHTFLAEVYHMKGRTAQALLHIKIAGRYHEGQAVQYHLQTAKLFVELGQYDEAAKQLKSALRLDPGNKWIRSQFRQVLKATNVSRFSLWRRWGF